MPERPETPREPDPTRPPSGGLVDDLRGAPGTGGEAPVDVIDPTRVDRVTSSDGTERWKLTCLCGKRIHVPFRPQHPIGRCPKCGRRLRLPGFKGPSSDKAAHKPAAVLAETEPLVRTSEVAEAAKRLAETERRVDPAATTVKRDGPPPHAASTVRKDGPPPRASTQELEARLNQVPEAAEIHKGSISSTQDIGKGLAPVAVSEAAEVERAVDESEDEVGTIVMEPGEQEALTAQLRQEQRTGREAALRTADMLRKNKGAAESGTNFGRISAWPLAGRLPRVLAGFIDLTLNMLITGIVVALGSLGLLPAGVLHPVVLLLIFFLTGLFNDAILQLTGGSLGKRLVVLTVRARGGQVPNLPMTLLRGALKWLLMPGWIVGVFDPAERTLHDLVCGTLVLKGRTRG
ncbi:MAG: hypothetical protein AMXMBFR7_46150 [Planctomycetota bacterium]